MRVFIGLILVVPAAATAPALVIVGVFMMQSITEIDMTDFKTAAPAVLTILGIPLTFSIAEGISDALRQIGVLMVARVAHQRPTRPIRLAVEIWQIG